jgi:hypothetical protein
MKFTNEYGQVQYLEVADLLNGGIDTMLRLINNSEVDIVYSDPPWNPGNEKWWRRYAHKNPPIGYNEFLDSWCQLVSAINPSRIFVEQSVNYKYNGLLFDAIDRCDKWILPLANSWIPLYGNPKRPYKLFYFGSNDLDVDVNGFHGESTTRKIFDSIPNIKNSLIVDPCTGTGMTSRMAHHSYSDFVGIELNEIRLNRAIAWLLKKGYSEI